jgi:excinuclease UvrABC ATPase subunit
MASVVILAIALFLIYEKVVNAMSERMKFLLSLKHLSLFFLIFSREGGRRSAGEVKRGKVVKKLDSRFTI